MRYLHPISAMEALLRTLGYYIWKRRQKKIFDLPKGNANANMIERIAGDLHHHGNAQYSGMQLKFVDLQAIARELDISVKKLRHNWNQTSKRGTGQGNIVIIK